MNLVMHMQQSPDLCQLMGEDVRSVFGDKNFLRIFTQMGISRGESLTTGVFSRMLAKVLPEYKDRSDAKFWIERLFSHPEDYLWVVHVRNEGWSRFLRLLGFEEIHRLDVKKAILRQVLNAIRIISLRIDALSLDADIIQKLPEIEKFDSPFVMQHLEVSNYLDHYFKENYDRTTDNTDYRQIMILIDQCEGYVTKLRERKHLFGVSARFTNYYLRLGQNVRRIRTLLYLVTTHEQEVYFDEEINFFKSFLERREQENNLRNFFSEHLSFIAYQITEYTGQAGEKYIATNYRDYFKMFLSSCQGGLIVAFLVLIKLRIYFLNLPLFGTAFGYSINYGLGFVLIHITGSKLATKQPAMTASKLAATIDESMDKERDELAELAEVIKLILRSQFIAFTGNVLVSFMIAFGIGYFYQLYQGEALINAQKAHSLIMEVHPTKSLSIFYAALTGVYLFISGLIAGHADNFSVIQKIPERLKFQPYLRRYLAPKALVKLSDYTAHNFGAIWGNFMLGVFLGTTSTIGKIIGLPLDIRHITFSAGNIGVAISSLSWSAAEYLVIDAVMGITLIGLMNFTFSFMPSLYVAVKSREVHFRKYGQLFVMVSKMFLTNPFSFILPIGGPIGPKENI